MLATDFGLTRVNWLHLFLSFSVWFIVGPLYLLYWLRRVKRGASVAKVAILLLLPLYAWLFLLVNFVAQ